MYEEITFESIMESMMIKVPKNVDKREGSIIWDALAPAALELENIYIGLDMILGEAFGATASMEYLAQRAAERGVRVHFATKAVLKGIFNIEVPIDSRYTLGDLNYIVIEQIQEKEYKLECETEGTIGNTHFGSLIPIEYLDGLESAELTEVLIPGEDDEEEEHFRERYFSSIQKPSTSGNKYDYTNWALECSGVGAVQVFPLAEGAGTVKLVIANSEKKGASQELLDKVLEYIEEKRPVGATVSVVSSREKEMNVTADIMIQNGVNLGVIQTEFKKNLESYLQNIAFKVTDISIAKIGSLLLDTIGVADFFHLKINNAQQNISLTNEEIPVVGSVTLGVV